MKRLLFFIFCCCTSPFLLTGQSDTTLLLKEIEVSTNKLRKQPIGTQIKKWESKDISNLPANNIADLIGNESGTFIKSYGLGSLATSSIRGGNAGHTLVLWNGFSLQSPTLGLLDLSLLPLSSAEEISFQKGGNSAIWGSGAVGGVIALNNIPRFDIQQSLNFKTTIGSFGNVQNEVNIGYGNARIHGVTKISHLQGKNNFKYFLAPDLPKREQTNAEVSQQNFMQDIYWKLDKKNQLAIHFWRQFSDRNIPPTNVQTRSLAHQNDRSTRIMADWKNIQETFSLQGKIGFFHEHLDYFDDVSGLVSLGHFNSYTAEFNGQKFLGDKHKIFGAVTHFVTTAQNDGYQEKPVENRSAVQLSYLFQQNNYKIQASIRQEVIDENIIPIVPSIGFDYSIFSWIKIQGKVSRNYRAPTLNDRFWVAGGNPELKPESGWSEEATILSPFKIGKHQFEISLTCFNRNINDWILWAPSPTQSIWSAFNISEVWSRGLEPRLSYNFKHAKKNNFRIKLDAGYDFVKSTNEVAMELPRRAKGEQIIYVPLHSSFGRATISLADFSLSYQHNYTGKMRGQFGDIDSYHVANTRFQYSKKWNDQNCSFFFNINNLWDTNYLIVERRPMPGRNYQIGINLSFNKLL